MANRARNGSTCATATATASSTPAPARWMLRYRNCGLAPTSGLVARAPPPGRTCSDHCGRDLLSARGVHAADGEAGRDPRITRLSKGRILMPRFPVGAAVPRSDHGPLVVSVERNEQLSTDPAGPFPSRGKGLAHRGIPLGLAPGLQP